MEPEFAGFFLRHRSWLSSLVPKPIIAVRDNLYGLGTYST